MPRYTRRLNRFEVFSIAGVVALTNKVMGLPLEISDDASHLIDRNDPSFLHSAQWSAKDATADTLKISLAPASTEERQDPEVPAWLLSIEHSKQQEPTVLKWDQILKKAFHQARPKRFVNLEHFHWYLEEPEVLSLVLLPEHLLVPALDAVSKVLTGYEKRESLHSEKKPGGSLRLEVRSKEWRWVDVDVWNVWIQDRREVAVCLAPEEPDGGSKRYTLKLVCRNTTTESFRKLFDDSLEKHLYGGDLIKGGKFDGTGQHLDLKEKITLDDLVFDPKVVERLRRDIFGFFALQPHYRSAGLPFKRGVLLEGPPGTGKTSLAKVIASTFPQTVLWVKGGDISKPGDISRLFRLARHGMPAVLFFEDADLYLRSRESGKGQDDILATFIAEMDGLESNDGLLVILTTNRKFDIESAISDRPGRIDATIHLGELGREQAMSLLTKRMKGWTIEKGWEADVPALFTITGAATVELATRMISRVVTDEKILAARVIPREVLKRAIKEQDRAGKNIGFRTQEN